MYFEEFVKKIGVIKANKEKAIAAHTDELKKTGAELAELQNVQAAAADSGNDTEYVELVGKIAVLEAKLKRLDNTKVIAADPTAVADFTAELNKAYIAEMNKQVKVIQGCIDKIMDASTNMAAINEEYQDIVYSTRAIDADPAAFINEGTSVEHFHKALERFIDPLCEAPNPNSVRGWLLTFRY